LLEVAGLELGQPLERGVVDELALAQYPRGDREHCDLTVAESDDRSACGLAGGLDAGGKPRAAKPKFADEGTECLVGEHDEFELSVGHAERERHHQRPRILAVPRVTAAPIATHQRHCVRIRCRGGRRIAVGATLPRLSVEALFDECVAGYRLTAGRTPCGGEGVELALMPSRFTCNRPRGRARW
jgi:hypothetical protein